ncbi:MAG: ROK family protein, partial [Lachnospiraceae bacterium]|nr:ROK family protein [Lachnospiraceae bacterium]
MKKYVFGVDIGGTTVKLGYFTVEGELLDKWEIPTRKDEGGRFILPDVAATIEAKLQEKSVGKDEVAGVGI